MAANAKSYERKISDEEAQGKFILILKSGLDLFPKPGKPFDLIINGREESKKIETTLTSVQRWSVGPSKPQDHYRIDIREHRNIFPLHFGKKIQINKTGENEYTLS